MRTLRRPGFCVSLLVGWLAACTGPVQQPSSGAAPSAAAAAPAPAPAGPLRAARRDTAAATRDSLMQLVLSSIAGREAQPAESVFRNIRVLRGMPAGRLVRVMNLGFGRSLGVSCTHCHTPGEWESDAKPTKQVAREMWTMDQAINTEHLARIPNLRSARPTVNCTTCHAGSVKPALELAP